MNESLNINELIVSIINIIIIPLLPVASAYIIAFIRKKTAELEANINNKEMSNYIHIAETAIITSVTSVNQIFVEDLKKKNGKLSAYEQRVAFEMAKDRVLNILGEATIKVIQQVYKDFDTWIDNRIEYYVNQSKVNPEVLKLKAFE